MARLSDRVVTGAPTGILANDEPIQWYAADGITLIDGIKVDAAGDVYLAPAGGPTKVGGTLDVSGVLNVTGEDLNISGGVNPFLQLNDGTDAGYLQLTSGFMHLYYKGANAISIGDSQVVTMAGDLDVAGQYRQTTAPATYANFNSDDLVLGTTVDGSSGMTIVSGTLGYGNIFFSNGTVAADQYAGYLQYIHNTDTMGFGVAGLPAMNLSSTGLDVFGGLRVSGYQATPLTNEGLYGGHPSRGAYIQGHGSANDFTVANQSGTIALAVPQNTINVEARGDLDVAGALSKGSGSFRIDHPLKPDTHQLVHSFTESPQADLLYSGTSDLVDGAAEINLDEFHGMTEGTFVALNRNIRVFTTNESDWEPIKGSVTGNILSISCQDASCSDKVSWMVIGERQDKHMMDTDWTDEQGRVIVEPLKPEPEAFVEAGAK